VSKVQLTVDAYHKGVLYSYEAHFEVWSVPGTREDPPDSGCEVITFLACEPPMPEGEEDDIESAACEAAFEDYYSCPAGVGNAEDDWL
jgi:hypothetical protein